MRGNQFARGKGDRDHGGRDISRGQSPASSTALVDAEGCSPILYLIAGADCRLHKQLPWPALGAGDLFLADKGSIAPQLRRRARREVPGQQNLQGKLQGPRHSYAQSIIGNENISKRTSTDLDELRGQRYDNYLAAISNYSWFMSRLARAFTLPTPQPKAKAYPVGFNERPRLQQKRSHSHSRSDLQICKSPFQLTSPQSFRPGSAHSEHVSKLYRGQ